MIRRPHLMIGLFALGLILRAAYCWRSYGDPRMPTDSDFYEPIALSILQRGEFARIPGQPTSLREPVYPLFIAAAYGATGGRHPWAVVLLQTLLSLASAWMIYRLGEKLFGGSVALAALAVCLFYPQSIFYCAYFYRDTLLTFLFTALALNSSRWSQPGPDAPAALGGLAAAALGLANSALLPALALAGAALWLCAPPAARWRRLGLYAAPLLLGCGLWTARNFAVHGVFVAGSTHGGEEFYQALIVPPDDLGTSRQTEILARDRVWQETVDLPEAQRNSRLLKACLEFIRTRPGLFASRVAAGVVKFWKLWPYHRDYNHPYWILVALCLVSDAWIVPLGLWGLWRFRARWRLAPLPWVGAAGLTAVYGSVHAVIRYRLPLMGCMILLACAAAAELTSRASINSKIR